MMLTANRFDQIKTFVKSLHGKGARQMPPKSSLDAKEIDLIKTWVAAGAKNN